MSDKSRRTRKRKRDSDREALDTILARLNTLENRFSFPPPEPSFQLTTRAPSALPDPPGTPRINVPCDDISVSSNLPPSTARAEDATDRIVDAITSLVKVRSNHYFVSNFDPSVHNIDVWCDEVDKAKQINGWDDTECISRIGNCLKGDARIWLNEWSTSERTWTNFKLEFKSLCPRNIDIASILFEVMCTDSRSFATYAEYARRSLLRLGLVKGLSDELIVAIIIKGIIDPHIKAAAANANLQPKDLVHFLSMYVKPNTGFRSTRELHNSGRPSLPVSSSSRNRVNNYYRKPDTNFRCHICGKIGHKRTECPNKLRSNNSISSSNVAIPSQNKTLFCVFCKKNGHIIDNCFAKQRSESSNLNTNIVNFCKIDASKNSRGNNDITAAVIRGIPVDVLIDSGSCISLISTSLIRHFSVQPKPTYRLLRGIGSQNIESTSYVTLIVEFPELSIEVDFYVVSYIYMNTPIIVGTDVLNRGGVTYIRRNGVHILTRTEDPSCVHAVQLDINSVNTPLEGVSKNLLLSTIGKFSSYLISGTATSTVTTGSLKIVLTSPTPIRYRPYKMSYDEKLRVRSIISDLMSKGIVRESESAYASPVILVKKKDGTDRMCVDYRSLNAITVKDSFPLPLIDDHIDRLGSSMVFTCLDMATGFHQLPVEEQSIDKTAFVTSEGHFEYVKMPYGTANYSQKTACIARLTKKNSTFDWGSEQDEARKYLIECLTSEPVLAIFNPLLPTELHTDASAIGYGAVLIQIHEGGLRRAIAYFSKATQGAESKYHSYELETLAVVRALQHFRQYLLGISFKIITDCNALKLTSSKKDLLPRVARWWLYMQDFQYMIEYRKGTLMSHADYLSRNPVDVCNVVNPKNWARLAQSADEETLTLIDKLNNGELDSSRYVIKNNLLYYRYTPVGENYRLLCFIPKGNRLSLLHVFHDDHDHIGVDKTIDLILRHFWFPSLHQFVRKYIKHCIVCLSHKKIPRAPRQPIKSWSKPDNPFSVIHMDVLGPLPESRGFKFNLIIVDAFSKYCLIYPMYRQDSEELKRVFTNTVSLFGSPKLIITDRGRMFESSAFQELVMSLGSETHFITPGMHHENGQVERYCRTLLNLLRVEVNHKGQNWSDVLWKIQFILNTTKHNTTKTSPFQMLIGCEASTPIIRSLIQDVALDMADPNRESIMTLRRQNASTLLSINQQKQDEYVNKGRRLPRSFQKDDFVFVIKTAQAAGKLDSCMRGPYRVLAQLPHDRYKLELVVGSYGKRTEAAAENMVPWKGEWTPDACAAFFETEQPNSSTVAEIEEDASAGSNGDLQDSAVEDVPQSGEAV